jgi:hypothetical protein
MDAARGMSGTLYFERSFPERRMTESPTLADIARVAKARAVALNTTSEEFADWIWKDRNWVEVRKSLYRLRLLEPGMYGSLREILLGLSNDDV